MPGYIFDLRKSIAVLFIYNILLKYSLPDQERNLLQNMQANPHMYNN